MGDFPTGGASLSTGEKLRNLHGSLLLRLRNSDSVPDHIGTLSYNSPVLPIDFTRGFPASYFGEVFLPKDQFEDLVASIRVGKMPTKIVLESLELKLKTEREIFWDAKNSPDIRIRRIIFDLPLAAVPREESERDLGFHRVETPSFHPVNQEDANQLAGLIRLAMETTIQRMDKLFGLIAAIGIIGLLILLFRHW
jgi:hypothetical protein